MSTLKPTGQPPAAEHSAHLQHQFDNPRQQFDAAVQGMWLFLATEILLFAGLFCVYAVYRANHPEIFYYAHVYLSKPLGALNTAILLCSSFTMATGVWAAQRRRQKLLAAMLVLTFLGACGFLTVKYAEYKHKWEEGLGWGQHYHPKHIAPGFAAHEAEEHGRSLPSPASAPASAATSAPASAPTATLATDAVSLACEPRSLGPQGLAPSGRVPAQLNPEQEVRNVQTFFAIYFALTGLHGVHVIAGMAVILWLLARTLLGHFAAGYYTPVELGGLYWHLVDIIWIYLFPLLYLIH